MVSAALLALAAIAVINRYKVIDKPWGYIRFDRWTGKAVGCDPKGCAEYGLQMDALPTPEKGKRNVTVTFLDGSRHIYQGVPADVLRSQIIARAEQENGKRVTEVCCLLEPIHP